MKNISKQELISNLQDKISQFKSNFTKIKESRKEVPELNFEINRDGLKHFFKNKADTEDQIKTQNQLSSKPQSKIDEIYNIQNILNDKNDNQKPKINQNAKNGEKLINKGETEEYQSNIGAKIKKSYTLGSKESYNTEGKGINNINNNIYNINVNKNYEINNNENLNIIGYGGNNINQKDLKNNISKKPETNDTNNILDNLDLNNRNNQQFNFDKIKANKNLEKRDKSAPKITINQKINNFYEEKPLADIKNDNFNIINHTSNYNQLFNINNTKKTNSTEELYQKLLMNFNINSTSNKRDKTFYNLNYINNNNNNNKFSREDNPNKSFGQINIRDTHLLYETNGNSNFNYNFQKRNNYRNGLNLDHLKDLYSKKTEDNKRPTQSIFKSKMDMFYQELNEYNKANNNKKMELKNYSKKNKYTNNNNYMANTQYSEYVKNNTKSNMNNYQNLKNENNDNINKNVFNGNKIGYNEIVAVKKYLNDLSKEEINNLPNEIKTELKDIFNILYQKLND